MKTISVSTRLLPFVTLTAAGVLILSVSMALARKESSPAPGNSRLVYAEIAKAPDNARAKHNPFESDPEAIAAGRKLFEQHCAECHGRSAEGGRRGPSLRAAEVRQAAPGALFWILTNGVVRRGMPVWSKLPEAERWQLVTYLQTLQSTPTQRPEARQ